MRMRAVAALAVAVVLGVVAFSEPDPAAELRPDPETQPSRVGADGCPAGAEEGGLGPVMRRLPEGFCIDTTEVTREQYEAWLATEPTPAGDGPCTSNEDATPTCGWPPAGNGAHPVVCVDWCDAAAFCEAAGKRLCAGIGGGAYTFDDYADPARSEWQAACSSGGAHEYTYGDTLDTERCRDADADVHTEWGTADVGSFGACQSPEPGYAGVFDLSGHVAEWEAGCVDESPSGACRIRGGSYQHHGHGLRCAMGARLEWPRDRTAAAVGFRCCAD